MEDEGPIRVSRRGLIDPSIVEANKPISPEDLQVHSSDLSFAQIVLADGVVLPIEPRGRHSLRNKSELDKYDGKEVNLEGYVIWKPGAFYEREINSITNLRLICNNKKLQSVIPKSAEWQGKKIDIVRTKADSLKFNDRRVQIIGKYVTADLLPGASPEAREFNYIRASIELADGTLIPIFPPYHLLSLRSSAEVNSHNERTVKIVGLIKLKPEKSIGKSAQRIMLLSIDKISLESE